MSRTWGSELSELKEYDTVLFRLKGNCCICWVVFNTMKWHPLLMLPSPCKVQESQSWHESSRRISINPRTKPPEGCHSNKFCRITERKLPCMLMVGMLNLHVLQNNMSATWLVFLILSSITLQDLAKLWHHIVGHVWSPQLNYWAHLMQKSSKVSAHRLHKREVATASYSIRNNPKAPLQLLHSMPSLHFIK